MAKALIDIQKDIDLISKIDAVPTILEILRQSTQMGFIAIARVTDEKWVACAVNDTISFGLKEGGELILETTICHEIRETRKAVVIDHVAEDKIYCLHHTPKTYGFQSYLSMPIILKNGQMFGTLCAIDPKPAKLNNPHILGMFRMYADLISFHIDAMLQLESTEINLLEERGTAELRDQFIAILGHDLRNPVGAISNAAELLLRIPGSERAQKLAHIIQDSTYRVKSLIDNILDFAKGRMGDGIDLTISAQNSLENTLNQVISELQLIHNDRLIEVEINLAEAVYCDPIRVAQLFSNLVANALTHGDKNAPISIKATTVDGQFKLSVSNAGEQIPQEKLAGLFKPFYRGENKSVAQGLGLGLYIAQQIAEAHGGNLSATSTQEQTCFTFSV